MSKPKADDVPKVAEAAGASAATNLSARIEMAMNQATLNSYADGKTGDDDVRAAKLAARDAVKALFAAEQAATVPQAHGSADDA